MLIRKLLFTSILYEEVNEQYNNVISHDVTSLLKSTTEPWGQTTCFVSAPEGYIIGIGSWSNPYEEKDK